jgi:hypothetical protein
MDEIGSSVQMLQVSLQGVNMAGRATVEGAKFLKRATLIVATGIKCLVSSPVKGTKWARRLKHRGKTNIVNLKEKGGTLSVHSMDSKTYELFQKNARKWGILYHKNPELKKYNTNGNTYISYPAEQAPLMERLMEYVESASLKEAQKRAEKEAREKGFKGSKKDSYVSDEVEKWKKEYLRNNRSMSNEDYAKASGMKDCTDSEFEQSMYDTYGHTYTEVKNELMAQDVKKNDKDIAADIFANSLMEQKNQRVYAGAKTVTVKKDDVIDIDSKNKTALVKTGLKNPDGRNLYLKVDLKDVYKKKNQKFDIVLDKNTSVTLQDYKGTKSFTMPGHEFAENMKKYSEQKTNTTGSMAVARSSNEKKMSR